MLRYLRIYFSLIPIIVSYSYSEPKVKEDYSQIGVEGPTTVEINIPNINRESDYISDPSYRFTLTPNFSFWPLKEDSKWSKTGVTAAYVGIYDFYFGTKESGPVVSRLQNPFLYFFTEHNFYKDFSLKFNFGMGHESNGQFITNEFSHDRFVESFNDSVHGYAADGENPRYYEYNMEDYASMGWNYYFFDLAFKRPKILQTNAKLTLSISPRWFFTHGTFSPTNKELEDNIFYDGKLAGKTSIRNYDGVRYSINWLGDSRHFNFWKNYYLIYDPSFSIGLKHGYFTSSFHPTLLTRIYFKVLGSLPLFYEFRRGYGRDLSNYPYEFSSQAIGIGFGRM